MYLTVQLVTTLLPIEPPAPSVGRGAGAALGRLVIVPVHRGEGEPVMSGQTVTGVTRVAANPEPVILIFSFNPPIKQKLESRHF